LYVFSKNLQLKNLYFLCTLDSKSFCKTILILFLALGIGIKIAYLEDSDHLDNISGGNALKALALEAG